MDISRCPSSRAVPQRMHGGAYLPGGHNAGDIHCLPASVKCCTDQGSGSAKQEMLLGADLLRVPLCWDEACRAQPLSA